MSEITVLAYAEAKVNCEKKLEAAFCAAMPPTHAEKGCIKYALQQLSDNARSFVMIEKWSSKEALDLHLKAPHIQILFKKFNELLAKPIEIKILNSIVAGSPGKLL